MITRRRIFCFVLATLEIITRCSISVSSWHFLSFDNVPQQGQIPTYPEADFSPNQGLKVKAAGCGGEQACRGLSRLGSRPPSCEHKCEGCIPCNAIQIPTHAGRKGLQYANYEPEGWKCKCGPTFFNP